jgi:RNA-directed DNA polymerase
MTKKNLFNRKEFRLNIQENINKRSSKHTWIPNKTNPHFDNPMKDDNAVKFAIDFHKGAIQHSFHPLIHFNINKRKSYIDKKDNKRKYENKPRPIYYSSHKDNYIYAYTAHKLSDNYEKLLLENNLSDSILAYRKQDIKKNNIDYAKDAFNDIDNMKNCLVIALDIKSFFDNLDHRQLKKSWIKVYGNTLPKSHYKVFKAITKYSYVNKEEVLNALGLNKSKKLPFPLCDNDEFAKKIRTNKKETSLIKNNPNNYGIPQGTAMSAFLSNIYMLEFDIQVKKYIESLNGIYRRYSDDILFIVPINSSTDNSYILSSILGNTNNILNSIDKKLYISEKKTVISLFKNGILDNKALFKVNDKEIKSDIIQYLGFTYNGSKILLRDSTLARYWQRTKKEIRRSIARAYVREIKNGFNYPCKPKREFVYEQFTELGHKYNFINGYIKQAIRKMDKKQGIEHQLENHLGKIKKEFNKNLSPAKARRIRNRKRYIQLEKEKI